VTVKAIGVHHNELGNQHRSLGLILETTRASSKAFEQDPITRYGVGILGDTDGNEDYVPAYVRDFREADILILHLGTFSNAKLGRGGKHLYIDGVRRVLARFGEELSRDAKRTVGDKKVVVLSEFGLELADDDLLYRKLQPFIESHSWRLPLIFTGLYLREQGISSPIMDGEEKDVSRFFARASLAILEKVSQASHGSLVPSQQVPTGNNLDELVVSLAFAVLAFDSEGLRAIVRGLYDKLAARITSTRMDRCLDGLGSQIYLDLVRCELNGKKSLYPLRAFARALVERAAFGRAPIPTGRLVESCDCLIERVGGNLENIGHTLYYVDKLRYIAEYSESRGLFAPGTQRKRRSYRWAYGRGDHITSLGCFWTACLIGVVLLRDDLTTAPQDSRPPGDNPLIEIGSFFRKGTESWANLLVGDIGCTFGLDPFSRPHDEERIQGIRLMSSHGEWISPYAAECFYDQQDERITYRAPQAAETVEKPARQVTAGEAKQSS
jgi:hypothetical protein